MIIVISKEYKKYNKHAVDILNGLILYKRAIKTNKLFFNSYCEYFRVQLKNDFCGVLNNVKIL